MADREETVTINVKGNAARAYREIEGAIKKARGQIDGSSTSAREARKRARNLQIALVALAAAAAKVVQAFAEQEASTGRLERAFSKAGSSARDFAKAQDEIRRVQNRHGIAVTESNDAMRKLIQSTGDAQTAMEDYALAVDLAAAEDMGLAQAAQLISRARDGNVESMQELSGITKDFAQQLGTLTDEEDRAAIAVEALSEKYEGAAEELEGTADQIGATKQALNEMMVALGEVTVAGGEFVRRGLEIVTFSEDGELSITNIATAFTNFADAIRETTTGLSDFADEMTAVEALEFVARGGVIGAFFGSGGEDIVQKVKKRAKESRKAVEDEAKEAAAEAEPVFVGPAFDAEARLNVKKQAEERRKAEEEAARKAEEEKKKEEERRAEARKRAYEQRKAEEARAAEEAVREMQAAVAEAEERAFREQMARLRLQGEERQALEAELARRGATEGETELSLQQFDERIQKEQEAAEVREREVAQRQTIARLTLEGKELEADLAAIRFQNLTPLEEELAIRQRLKQESESQEEVEKKRAEARQAAIDATANATSGLIGMLASEEAARRSAAAIDALVYGYKAVASFAEFNIPSGLQFSVAAAQAGAVAAGSGASGASASPASRSPASSTTDPRREERTRASLNGDREPSKTENNFYFRSVASPSPRDIRQIGDANEMSQTQRIGGRGRR